MRNQFRVEGDMKSPSTTKAALAWVDQGAKIMILHSVDEDGKCTCGKSSCKSPGKHPWGDIHPRGQHSAISNSRAIRRALKKHPNSNIAVILPEGVIALDVDGPKGEAALNALDLTKTLTVKTGRGKHYYFLTKEPLPKKRKSLTQVDIKDSGSGYIVVPPSKHQSGVKYRWVRTRTVAQLPSSFGLSLETTSKPLRKLEGDVSLKAGGRNNTLTQIAGWLRYRGLSATAIDAALQAINGEACVPPLDNDEVAGIAGSVSKYDSGHETAFGCLDDVEATEAQFLAYPYIVKGAVTVLDGNMGQGKSTFTVAVAAAVTTGEPPLWVDEIEMGSVLFMSAEDDPSRVLKPRLLKAGADVSKVRYQCEPFTLDEKGLTLLRSELAVNTPAIVIIDPIIAFMKDGADGNKATETMHFMVQIDQLAREFDTSILIVRHLRKSKADHAMHQGIGSISIAARVRSGLILAPHPDDPSKRVVAHAKANYTELGPAIVFEMENTGPRSHPRLKWNPSDPHLSAEDILVAPSADRGRPPKERDTATAWLESVLRKGPAKKSVLEVMAKKEGISPATLRRAGDTLRVVKSKSGRKSVWALP